MIDAALFDKLVRIRPVTISFSARPTFYQESIARIVRRSKSPFGGIQVSRPHLH